MKILALIALMALVLLSGCYETKKAIKTSCVKTDLWVLSSGKASTRQVYDCSNIPLEEIIKELKK